MKEQQNYKKENGITLIALVVTIVVLLILAGISISMVLGNNGLITKAKDAKTQTEQDQLNTDKAINSLVDEIDDILGNSEEDELDDTETLVNPQIGDYVNYIYDTVTTGYNLQAIYSGNDEDKTIEQSATVLQWRILNIDEERGTLDLVSATPSDNTVSLKGALGYNNGVYLLNDICKSLYSNSSLGVEARSINLTDMENYLTSNGVAARNAYYHNDTDIRYSAPVYGNIEEYTTSDKCYYPNLYATQKGSGINTITVTQPNTDGTIIDPYEESLYDELTTETYSQAEDSILTVTQTNYKIPVNKTNYGIGAELFNTGSWYWLASSCIHVNPDYATYFGLRITGSTGYDFYGGSYGSDYAALFVNNENQGSGNYAIRPMVTLSTSILDGTKDDSGVWNLKY